MRRLESGPTGEIISTSDIVSFFSLPFKEEEVVQDTRFVTRSSTQYTGNPLDSSETFLPKGTHVYSTTIRLWNPTNHTGCTILTENVKTYRPLFRFFSHH